MKTPINRGAGEDNEILFSLKSLLKGEIMYSINKNQSASTNPSPIFTRILSVEIPGNIKTGDEGKSEEFTLRFTTDGPVPFPQVIIRDNGREILFNGDKIESTPDHKFSVRIPKGLFLPGKYSVQVEGCRKEDWRSAGGGDWIKWNGEFTVNRPQTAAKITSVRVKGSSAVKIYFGIHKHMHQPFYRAADTSYWDGEKESIFGSRCGPYTHFIPDAVKQYSAGGLPHGGLSTSWSGSLIEQLNRCDREGLCGGCFRGWNRGLSEISNDKTSLGHRRMGFTAFGYFHPLMPLIPHRDIVKQIALHSETIKKTFGTDTSGILFPPETAFHVRIIPALKEAGIKAVIYDSIHRYRSCKDYPYAGINEGMLPPNRAEQINGAVDDWIQLQNIWAGSKISPSLLKPEYIKYEDPDGKVYTIIGVPAERYIGNEDARGGYGALQYEQVLGQVYDSIVSNGTFDPAHPPFFILHSDGDNHGGGADSYYHHNTGRMVEWLKRDERFELTTIDDYLEKFPPDPEKAVHIEPGSWSGADNGDPQFRKWFSMYDQPYSPDLNSWAVLTALQNHIHSLEDAELTDERFRKAERLMLTAETSCYWYWTGQEIWDRQVTEAANAALSIAGDLIGKLKAGVDKTGPTIFAPWVTPENPGGKTWGQGCLRDAEKTATVHAFIYDINGIERVELVLRSGGKEDRIPMKSSGPYPSRTSPSATADYYRMNLPGGLGDVRYYIEAVDRKGNRSRSGLERIFLE